MSLNNFCRHLSNGYRIYIKDGTISYHPCCYWLGDELPFKKELLYEQRQIINNHTPWAHESCNRCKQEEQYKEFSLRSYGNKTIQDNLPSSKVGWIDIQADITCNGACLSCGPQWSSSWQNELSKHNEFFLAPAKKNLKELIDYIFTSIDTSELNMLQFLGGEPFLSEADSIGIDYIKNPENCILKYTTNASVYPSNKRIQQWKKFKEVKLTLSIDGIGDRFNYIRYPLKWEVVDKNIKRMINELPDNVTYGINHTINPFNVLYYNEFEDWLKDTFKIRPWVHAHTAYGIMSVDSLPFVGKKFVKQIYGPNHFITKLLINSDLLHKPERFLDYVEKWDQRRGLNWRTVFPEIAFAFDK